MKFLLSKGKIYNTKTIEIENINQNKIIIFKNNNNLISEKKKRN